MPLSFEVDSHFYMPGQGLVIAGTVQSGELTIESPVWISSGERRVASTVAGIERDRKNLQTASSGDEVALLFPDTHLKDLHLQGASRDEHVTLKLEERADSACIHEPSARSVSMATHVLHLIAKIVGL